MQKKGISLIVLVITIIVMIILAASVVISLNNTSMINKADYATQTSNDKQVETLASVLWADAYAENFRGTELKSEVVNRLINQGVEVNKYSIKVTDKGIDVIPDSSKVNTLAQTSWTIEEKISEYEFLGIFSFEEQNGYEAFPDGCIVTNGTVTQDAWGIAQINMLGINALTFIKPLAQERGINYIPENNLDIPEGWYEITNEPDGKPFFNVDDIDLEVIKGYLKPTIAPTIIFPETSNASLTNNELIDWLYENATRIK